MKQKREALGMTKATLSRKTNISYTRICVYELDNNAAQHMETCRFIQIAKHLNWDIKDAAKYFPEIEAMDE